MLDQIKPSSLMARMSRVWFVVLGALVVGLLSVGTWTAVQTQRGLVVTVKDQQVVPVVGPLSMRFGQEVTANFQARLEPAVAGTWQMQRTVLGVAGVVFEPTSRFEAGRVYRIHISGLKRVLTGAVIPDIDQTFMTQVAAMVQLSKPRAGAKDVAVRPQLSVELSGANQGVRDLRASLIPEVPLRLVSTNDRVFVWEPTVALKQGATYTFALDDMRIPDGKKRRLVSNGFTTVAQPVIVSARTGDHFAPGQTVDIRFDQAMETRTEAFVFDVGGKGGWVDDHTFRFTPDGIKPGATYDYRVKAGLRSKAGGVIEADRPFQFATNGAVTAAVSPEGGDVGLGVVIRVAFDQAVDHGSAETRFSLSPAVTGGFSWSGTTMMFTPAGLNYQTTYSYGVAPGVVPVWGLPSSRVLGGAFSTVPEVIQLSVPAYHGQYWMACELSSLRMLLAYRGVMVDDWAILLRLNYNPRPRDLATNTWDDPNLMYVGDVNGRPNKTGYGVHAGPLADAGKSFGRNTQAYSGVGAAWIASQVHAGNPVAFYSYSDAAPRPDWWNTPGGYVVQTMYPQHARVIYGVKGSASNPLGFYIHDPIDGGSFYWSADYVIDHMNAVPGVSNQAVVVY